MYHQASNSTCNLSMERPGLVQNHLLLSVIHQIVYCYLFPPTDCSQTFLWDGICFLKGGFKDLTKQHAQQKISHNNGFASQMSNPQSVFKMTIPTYLHFPIAPPTPNLSAITDFSGYPWKSLFQQYFCEQIFACPPFTKSTLKQHVS